VGIRDELKEIVFLKKPCVIIAEWIPFGNNQVAALKHKLGSMEHLKSTLMTALVDEFPEQSIFESDPVHSRVVVKDFDLTRYAEFEARVDFPEAEGITQKEEFGVHVCEQGLVVFALELEEVNGRKGEVSLDKLTRVNADLFMDSSRILETLLTHNQLRMLDVMHRGKARNRGKFVAVVAEDIVPHMKSALEYADGEDYQNELEQLVGTLEFTETLTDGSFIFAGSLGALLITKNLDLYEEMLGLYILVRSLDMFMDEYFIRLWLGWDEALKIRQMIVEKSDRDPTTVTRAKIELSKVGADAVVLEAFMGYLSQAIRYTAGQIERILGSAGEKQKELAEKLYITRFFDRVESRIDDAEKVVEGLKREVEGLQGLVATLSEKQMKKVYETLQDSSRATEEMLASSERSSVVLDLIQLVLAGSIAFDIIETIDILGWLSGVFAFLPVGLGTIIVMTCSLAIWGHIAFLLYRFMQYLASRHEPLLSLQLRLEAPCNVEKLEAYLATKAVATKISKQDTVTDVTKVTWEEDDREKWLGEEPKLSVVYDAKNGFLLNFTAEINNPNVDREKLRRILMDEIRPFLFQPEEPTG